MVAYFIVATLAYAIGKDIANLGLPLLFLAICMGLLALRWSDAAPILAFIAR